MSVSVVIPWFNRPDLISSLKENFTIFNFDYVEVIVVNYGGDKKQIDQIINLSNLKNIKLLNIKSEVFNKSRAINIGVFNAKNEIVFLLDCDIIMNDSIIDITSKLSEKTFLTLEKTKESEQSNDKIIKGEITEIAYFIGFKNSHGKEIKVETNRMYLSENSRSCPGLVIVSKKNFIKVNGMNSDLIGWGWEDIDLVYRLEYHNIHRQKKGSCIHLTHSDNSRYLIKENKAINEDYNFKKAMANYLIGDFLGTYLKDTINIKID